MQKQRLALGSIIKDMYLILKNSIVKVVLFKLIYNLIILLIIRPVIKLVINTSIKLGGYEILMNGDIKDFFLSLPGLIMGIIVFVIAVVAVYYEFAVITLLIRSAYDEKTMKISEAAKKAFYSFGSLAHVSTLGFAVYTLIVMPILNFGIHSSLFSNFEIPKFIISETEKYGVLGIILIILILVVGIYLFTQAFFVIPIMVFERENFYDSFKKSRNIIKGNKFRIFSLAIIVMIIWMVFAVAFSLLYSVLTLNMITLSFKILFVGILLAAELYTAPLFLSVLIVSFLPFENKEEIDYTNINVDNFIETIKKIVVYVRDKGLYFLKWLFDKIKRLFKEKTKIMVILTVILVAISSVAFIDSINTPRYVQTELIMGHRGSTKGVENTTESILSAADQGADYAEIDILLSKDGVPMVIHDFNLLRLTGHLGHLGDYTKDELQNGFIQRQYGYTSKIETLDEVCKNVKGKIDLLVELKTHGKETDRIVEKTVEVIMANGMENNVLYQTLEYPLLEEMKYRYPEVKIGYIIVTKVGSISQKVLSKMPPDFYGVEQTILTEDIVKACHAAGKPIYVWTVNETDYVKELFAMGVDGIITDYPELIRETKNSLDESALESEE